MPERRTFNIFPGLQAGVSGFLMTKYSRDLLARADELNRQGEPWAVVSERLGVPEGKIRSAIGYYRRGQHKGVHEQTLERLATIEALITQGLNTAQIARALGLHRRTLSNILQRHGLTREIRQEMQLTPPEAPYQRIAKLEAGVRQKEDEIAHLTQAHAGLLRQYEEVCAMVAHDRGRDPRLPERPGDGREET